MTELQVLHVDDEPDMRLLVKLSLDLDDGISTRSASSGPEALDATTGWRPDVILLDAVMPGMDGLATLKALQANPKTAGIPVLFLTSRCAASDIDSFKASGSAGVITKPFNPQALATAIRSYVQANAVLAAEPLSPPVFGSVPAFAGRSPVGSDAKHDGGGSAFGAAPAFGAFAPTTEALLLDGNGNAFALTITDHSLERSGGVPSAAAASAHAASKAAGGPTAPALTMQVATLDAATVRDLLGPDTVSLLTGNGLGVADRTAIAGLTFPIDHAIGCAPSGGTHDPFSVGRQGSGLETLHHAGSINPSSDWAALVLPRAAMH